jgi:CRP-like cAMP-binding protein
LFPFDILIKFSKIKLEEKFMSELKQHPVDIKNKEGTMVAIATLRKGRSIGEMSIIDEAPRSATIRARTKSTVILINRVQFNQIIDKYPFIGIKILKGLARLLSMNIRKTSSRLADYMLPIT